jgi:putative methanogenesis marker protein 17
MIAITADSDDKTGGELYEYIARRSVEELALSGSVLGIKMYMRSSIPLFIIKIVYREFVGRDTIGELARVEERENGIKVILQTEMDLGDSLKTLWSTYGRDSVEQSGRLEIIVTGAKADEVKETKIRDKKVDVSVRINELAARIIPEGLRVRNVIKGDGYMTFIAAEDPLMEEWIKIASGLEVEA